MIMQFSLLQAQVISLVLGIIIVTELVFGPCVLKSDDAFVHCRVY